MARSKAQAVANRKVSIEIIPPDIATPITVESALVVGDDIEEAVAQHIDGTPAMISLTVDGILKVMIVDDLALPKELPRNERATQMYRAEYLANHLDTNAEQLPFVTGPLVLVDPTGQTVR